MKLAEIRQRAVALGVSGSRRLRKAELIRAIQLREGNQSCFGADWRFACGQMDCCWRGDCQTERPG
jgi:hypothetical protein